ncbi:MAG: class I SAM-dependent methyltransferase [Paracoccaceae bacterium]
MTDMWTNRYDQPDYVFGTEPTDFMRAAAAQIPPTDALCVADGEGRHSVFLAQQGFDVTAFDPAAPALDKARTLADARGVKVERHQATFESWNWEREFGLLAGLFIQFQGPEDRAVTFQRFRRTVRPGGHLVLQGFAPRQVEYGTGGPPHAENMYTEELLNDAFGDWDILHLRDHDAEVSSGSGHKGVAALVELIARRPVV